MYMTSNRNIPSGSGLGRPLRSAGAPSAGTNPVPRVTIGGTPTAGTFTLVINGQTTGSITWSGTNATLLANIDAAIEALPGVDASAISAAAVALTNGIGTLDITFAGNLGRRESPTVAVGTNALTGTTPTVAIAIQTAGVRATARGAPKGATLIDTTNGKHYINTGTPEAPTWTVTGTQT